MMKRSFVLCILILFLLCACRPTPEKDVVIGKAEGQLDELILEEAPQPVYQTEQSEASAAPAEQPIPGDPTASPSPTPIRQTIKTLRSTIGAPDRFSDSFCGKAIGDMLSVEIDANVDVPDISKVPVFTVRIEIPDGEKRETMLRTLLGEGPYYFPADEEKLMAENTVQYLKNYIRALEDKPYGESAPYDEMLQAKLDAVREMSLTLASFSETTEYTEAPVDPTRRSGAWMNGDHVLVRQTQDAQGSAVVQYTVCKRFVNVSNDSGMRAARNDREQSAFEAAQALANSMGITDTKATGLVCADEDRRLFWHTEQGVEDGIYCVSLVPLYAGIPCYSYTTFYGTDSGRSAAKAEPDYAWNPPQEMLRATVQDGAVTQLVWQYPCSIVSMDNANVSLLSFDEIMQVFRKQIFMNVYLDKGFPETMHVTDIRVSYLRMKKQNSEDFYLLPVWDFLGYCTDEEADDPLSLTWYENQSFLTVNAIDGSIIDRNVGY